MRHRSLRITAIIIIISLLASATVYAVGDTVYTNSRWLADNLEYTNVISWSASLGRTESFALRMTGPGDAYPIVMNGDTIYGTTKISNMVSYAESLGKNVLAAVNTDFFFMEHGGVPIGIVVEDGIYKSSPGGRNAVTIGYDGSVDIIKPPVITITLLNNGSPNSNIGNNNDDDYGYDDGIEVGDVAENDAHDGENGGEPGNAGKKVSFYHLNKPRTDLGGINLFSETFSTVSTRTSTPGWFVRFRILEGSLTVAGAMTLEVTETLTSDGAVPIGNGNLVLTSADANNLGDDFAKFAVGDIVTLTTACNDARLVNAQHATGGGDILVSGGAKTDHATWSPSLMSRAPRTAFGLRDDGSVVSYVIDGRNSNHSVGLTLHELADEMLRQGCVYAVNFDGGGSSAVSVRIPGEKRAAVANKPSDGSERGCATYVLFVTDAMPGGGARNLSLKNDGVIVLAESSVDLAFSATDKGYMPATVPGDVQASPFDAMASVVGARYTAGRMAGTDLLTLYSPSTGATGTGEIYVITRPTSITATRKGSTTPLTSVMLNPGQTLDLSVTATYYRRDVAAQLHSFEFAVSGNIGKMAGPGAFEAGLIVGQKGKITISAGGRSIDIDVAINGFKDMENHWAREYAEFLASTGVTIGVTPTEYGPNLLMKRGDYILMLYRAAGLPEAGEAGSFDDVPSDMYYADALAWAKQTGIAESLVGNNFEPQSPVSRQDAFTFTYRALGSLNKEHTDGAPEELDRFPDAGELAGYAAIPTATLIKLGVVEGSGGMLIPLETLTRAQMAKVLAVVMQLTDAEGQPAEDAGQPAEGAGETADTGGQAAMDAGEMTQAG